MNARRRHVELMDRGATSALWKIEMLYTSDQEERIKMQHHDDFADQHRSVHHHIVNVAVAAGAGKHEAAERAGAAKPVSSGKQASTAIAQHQRAVQAGG